MRQIIALILVLTTQIVSARALTVDESEINFGELFEYSSVAHDLRVWNNSSDKVTILAIKTLSGKGEATAESTALDPGASTIIHLKLDLNDAVGASSTRFLIEAQTQNGVEKYGIRLLGYVDSIFDEQDLLVDFDVIDKTKPIPSRRFALPPSAEKNLQILKIDSAPDFLEVEIQKDRKSIEIIPKNLAVLGLRGGVIKLSINSQSQKQLWIHVALDAHGAVIPNQNPLDFGLQRPGSRTEVRLQMNSRDGHAFRVGEPVVKDAKVDVRPTECLPKQTQGCRAYMFKLQKDQPIGQVFGTTSFDLPNSGETLLLNFAGLFLDDSTVVQPIENLKSSQAQHASSVTSASLEDAIKKSVSAPTEDVAPDGKGPLLKWQVGNESAIYGYGIFRSDNADGTFVRANKNLIRAKNLGDNVSSGYQFRDNTAEAGKEYWYYITIFYNSGKKVQLTGPQKVVAK